MEDWVEEGEKITSQQHKGPHRGLSDEDRNALWHWAPSAANTEARKQKWGADFTLEEKQRGIESVMTGLRRELLEPPDDEGDEMEEDEEEYDEVTDDEDEDKMEVEPTKSESKEAAAAAASGENQPVIPPANQIPLQSLHKFMTTGR